MPAPPITQQKILDLLCSHPEGLTYKDMQHELGMTHDQVWIATKRLRIKGLVYRARYEEVVSHGGQASPVICLGHGKEPKPPKAKVQNKRKRNLVNTIKTNHKKLGGNPFAQLILHSKKKK